MKIAFFDIKPDEKKYLQEHLNSGFEASYFETNLTSKTKLEENIKNSEIISVFINSNLSHKVLSQFKNLKYIVLRSVGFSHVDVLYAAENNIKIFNAPHYGDHSIAEFTFALLLSVLRKIDKASFDVKKEKTDQLKYQGYELCGKTIGIVGLGATGKIIADIARGFSMKPFYYDIKRDERYNYLSLNDLCKNSDIISINCPLNQDTLYMFDEGKFCMMKDGAVIINTARGEIIKTKALYEALISKKIAYAGLDVIENENLLYENSINKTDVENIKDSCFKNFYFTKKIMALENVLITPHIAYNTVEAKKRILDITIETLNSSIKFTN